MFGTALAQSIRSLLFTLIPAAIITFIAWATAGSAYASTTDPFRGAAWITLGAHATPFDLQIPPSGAAGWLTYLPLGAMVLPIIGIAIGARKTLDRTNQISSVWIFAFCYTILIILLALLSANSDVTVNWYWALAFVTPFVFLTSYLAINQIRYSPPMVYLIKSWCLILGFGALILGISLFINFNTVHQLATVLQPGLLGGILLLALLLLYLPNFIISTVAYFVGTGFAIGRDTLISPLVFKLGKIPAIPILGGLPTGKHIFYLSGSLVVILVGALVAYWTLDSGRLVLRQTIALFAISSFLIAYLGSGALITNSLGTVGPSLWKFPLAITSEFLVGVGAMRFLPLIGSIRK